MANTENPKLQTQIDIKSVQPPLQRNSTELIVEELINEQTIPVPFFRRLSRGKENTWIISVFVILHLIAFCASMIVNDCSENSHSRCVFKRMGRFSFQPLAENQPLGPFASGPITNEFFPLTLGALRLRYIAQATGSPIVACFHKPVLACRAFSPYHQSLKRSFRWYSLGARVWTIIGVIYILSALTGGLLAALFLQDPPSVSASSALFGLLGATLSALIQNWKFYSKKFATLMVFTNILMLNFILGLMPFVNNFSNIGGFISGFLAGFVLLFKPQVWKMYQNKGGIFDYDVKNSFNIRRKLDRRLSRDPQFSLVGVVVALFRGVNVNKYCSWCKYIDCVPLKWWSCSDKTMECEIPQKVNPVHIFITKLDGYVTKLSIFYISLEVTEECDENMLTMVSSEQLILTCLNNGKFTVFPFTNVSKARLEDLCNLMCS
ncbi:hypothetical protein CASFOL_000911 [Castilleja foliolosa]|uniref:RHOMBOID-like protein n=1 Tax=Castilleja foliolosa TaxID=1961234 RepID=A0ABD3EL21_9LAMI